MIRYLKHKDINKKLWDSGINKAINGLTYAQSWYLDVVSPGWNALVEGDYNIVMPLPCKKKYFLNYIIQPRFTQQLGVFSEKPVTSDIILQFIKAIPDKYIWRDLNFNSYNECIQLKSFSQRINYELNLEHTYCDIFKNYNENTKRNIVKAKQNGVKINSQISADEFLRYYSIHTSVNKEDIALEQLKQIVNISAENNAGLIIMAINISNEIIAGAFFLKDPKRIIYLTSFSTDTGKELSGMFMIMDKIIGEYSGTPMVFDFEGSMIAGIERFFKGFGAGKSIYYRYRFSIGGFLKK